MSGGFFRGTSADQDTRFSNKQAKLLKSQKFPPELDHLVDMSKVKMDVMKPWIAKRVTEFLGFEDEVLINFIYGLLEEKEADGKKIQIQLTGFMEKNTVKFMKELWHLLLSAQQNASGVPQQFLDAKEAEIQQRKAEDDRIAQEIQKKREKDERDLELEKCKMMDGDVDNSISYGVGSALNDTNVNAEEEKEMDFKRSSRTKSRRDHRSRSTSLSPHGRKRSISPRRRSRSPYRRSPPIDRHHKSSRRSTSPRHSISPRRHSPRNTLVSRRRSPYSRRGSPPLPRYPSPSFRWRAHVRRKSPLSGSRRSPSPLRHHSPARARAHRRSPSPSHRRSPVRHTYSPARRPYGSPARRKPRSPSPARRRPRSPSPGSRRPWSPSTGRNRPWSRSPVRRESLSPHRSLPMRSPKRHRRSPISSKTRSANLNTSPKQRRIIRPYTSKSPNRSRRSLSRDIEKGTNGTLSSKHRSQERSDGDDDVSNCARKGVHLSPDSEQHRISKSSRYPNNAERNSMRDSSFERPGKHIPSQDSIDTSADEEEGSRARENSRKANSARRKAKDFSADLHLKKVHDDSSPGEKSPLMLRDSGKSFQKKCHNKLSESSEEELAGRRMKRQADSLDDSRGKHQEDSYSKDGRDSEHVMKGTREEFQSDDGSPVRKMKKRTDGNSHIDSGSSGSEEPERHQSHSEKRRRKKAHNHSKHYGDSSESDSELDDKEAKRRRKEEKRLRKEERRQRREERHRRKAERHVSKQKMKHVDDTPSSDPEKNQGSGSDADVRKRDSNTSRGESDPKKLEIELREKALESLRAKKAINH